MAQSAENDAARRLSAPQRAAVTEAVNGPIPEPYGTRAEYVCATVEACVLPPGDSRSCEIYSQPGQDCVTAGLEVVSAEGLCGPCAMRLLTRPYTLEEKE